MALDENRAQKIHKEKVIAYICLGVLLLLFISAYVYMEFANIPVTAPSSAPVAAGPDIHAQVAATLAHLSASSTPASKAETQSVLAAMNARHGH